jgi:hypothetical protein
MAPGFREPRRRFRSALLLRYELQAKDVSETIGGFERDGRLPV